MTLREKTLGFAVAAIIAGFAGYQWAAEPALAWYAGVKADTAAAAGKLAEAQLLVDHRKQIMADWRARHAAGLMSDEKSANFHAQEMLSAAARASGFAMAGSGSGQRAAAGEGQSYDLLRLTLTGQGTLAQTQAFLAGIQQAALPLRIERCEMAAREGGRDQVDLSLTLSMRIASEAARKKMAIPPNTKAWQPPVRSPKMDQDILAARPFMSSRPSPASGRAPAAAATVSPAQTPGAIWMVVGLIVRDGIGEAWVVHSNDGEEKRLHTGDGLDDGVVKAIDADGLHLLFGTEERVLAPGVDLPGAPDKAGTASTSASPAIRAPAAGSGTVVTDEQKAILDNLRRKNRRTTAP